MKKLLYLFLAGLIIGCSTEDDTSNTLEKEWLYTHTALEATATSSTTIVMPYTTDIFAFTDRPYREHKYISGDEFASYWNDYDDENSFTLDPPNAVLTWVDAGGVSEVEVVITDAHFDGNNVIYTIEESTISANQSFQDVSLFVDGNGTSNKVYLSSNGVTVKRSAGSVAGDTGIIRGRVFTIVDESTLRSMITNGDDVTIVCTSLVKDMYNMFIFNSSFNQDISSWDVSNVFNMNKMFASNTTFNQDLSYWDVSNVINMNAMFANSSFNQDISSWDVSLVVTMESMFTYSSFNQDISSWDVSSVLIMSGMFANSSFNQDISTWDVSLANSMASMFYNSTFNQDISSWDVSNVGNMNSMFANSSFNQDISSWDVSIVVTMESMFANSSFNQDISSWSVDGVLNCTDFLTGSPLTFQNTPNFTNCTFS